MLQDRNIVSLNEYLVCCPQGDDIFYYCPIGTLLLVEDNLHLILINQDATGWKSNKNCSVYKVKRFSNIVQKVFTTRMEGKVHLITTSNDAGR